MRIINRQRHTDLIIDMDRDTHRSRLGYCLVSCITLAAATMVAVALPFAFTGGNSFLAAVLCVLFLLFAGIAIEYFIKSTKGPLLKRASRVVALCIVAFFASILIVEAGRVNDMLWQAYGLTSFVLCLMLFQLHRGLNPTD